MSVYAPVPKVIAAGLGGALATLLVWLLSAFGGPEVPAEAAAALSALLAFAAGYLKAPAGTDGYEPRHGDAGRGTLGTIGAVLLVVALVLLVAKLLLLIAVSGVALVIIAGLGLALLLVDGSARV